MKTETTSGILKITDLQELAAPNAPGFRDEVRGMLTADHKQIHIDLSQAQFVDSSGLGALLALHKTMAARQGAVCLLNPNPKVQKVLELTRLHRIFEIVQT